MNSSVPSQKDASSRRLRSDDAGSDVAEASSFAARLMRRTFARKARRGGSSPASEGSASAPGRTARNFESYGHKVSQISDAMRNVLCDPQTSGGLLVAVDPEGADEFRRFTAERDLDLRPFGRLTADGEFRVTVR